MNRRGLLGGLVVAACLAFAAFTAYRLSSSGRISVADVDWRFAIASAACMLAFALVYALCWWLLMDALQPDGARVRPVMRLFLLAWPGRYVPASLPYYGGRLLAGPDAGLSRPAVAASLVYENLFAIAVNGSIAVALLAVAFRDAFGGGAWVVAAVVASAAALFALHPAVVRLAIRAGASRVKRLRALDAHVLDSRAVLRIAIAYAAGSCLSGLAFWCALRALGDTEASLPLAIATYNLAGVAGMLAIAVPGGLGVREGVAVAVIGATVTGPIAFGAAALTRVAGVIADLLPLLSILAHGGWRKLRRTPVAEPVAAEARARAA